MNDAWEEDEREDSEDTEDFEPGFGRRRRRSDGTRPGTEQRGSWYLLTGLIIGLALGLLIAWVISPVQYTDTEPSSLSAVSRDTYRLTIALAYTANHDLGRARARLNLLEPGDPVQLLAAQAQRMVAENQPPQEARALAFLAADIGRPGGPAQIEAFTRTPLAAGIIGTPSGASTAIGESSPAAETGLSATTEPGQGGTTETAPASEASTTADAAAGAVQTPTLPEPTRTPTVTLTPSPTSTPRPTATPLPVMEAPFAIKSKREVCDGSIQPGLLQVQVTDADGKPLPGVRVLATWQDGEDTFYTGLAPEINPGYADFQMLLGVAYNLKIGDASDPVTI